MSVSVITKPVLTCGEGPHWDAATQSLIYVDIQGDAVHRWNSVTGEDSCIKLDGTVSFAVPRKSGGCIIGLNLSLVHLDWHTRAVTVLDSVDAGTGNRFNDAKCDPAGRLWAGTMDDNTWKETIEPHKGALYRLDKNGGISKQVENLTISNGLAWTSDKKTMYFVDSSPTQIYAYDYNHESGDVSNCRVAIDFSADETLSDLGFPDGMCIDTDDKLWVACFSGSKVVQFDPVTGKRLRHVSFPVKRITSCCFGGPNYDELYVTSSRHRIPQQELEETPLAGACFKVTGLGARGFAPNIYEG